MANDCGLDKDIQHLNGMVQRIKLRMKSNVGIDLDAYAKTLNEVNWTPKGTTNSWICSNGAPDGFGFKAKSVEAWYALRTQCMNKMALVLLAEKFKDAIFFDYGNPFGSAARDSDAWREIPSRDGASLHITMYRNLIQTDKADITIHLDRIAIATGRDSDRVANYNWGRVPKHVKVELLHMK